METVGASINWDGPQRNILRVFVEPTPTDYMPDLIDDGMYVYSVIGENDQDTGEIAGVEIFDFLEFDRWNDLPDLPILWQLPGWDPLPLAELLQRVQPELRRKAEAETSATAIAN